MGGRVALTGAIVVVFAVCFWAQGHWSQSAPTMVSADSPPERIVTMAPSVTETVFALGLGDRVVGVSSYCDYPPEALEKAKIGGFLNPNYERIVGLRPDAVIFLESSGRAPSALPKLRIPILEINHLSVDDILTSIERIGAVCGAEAKADEIVTDIRQRLDRVTEKTAGRPQPRVLVAIDRTLGTGTLQDVYITGRDGHIDRIIELAGGQNAYNEGPARFPVVSQEGILKINPEVVIDLAYGIAGESTDQEAIRADWQCLPQIDAVKHNRVYLVADDFATVPGPRFILFVEKLARLLHPEVDWTAESSSEHRQVADRYAAGQDCILSGQVTNLSYGSCANPDPS
jgi:iron complex transport system substrate-binding protein